MSSVAELSRRFTRLREISSIMTAMKSLSLVETHKLAHFIGHQRRMLANIEAVAADFLHFYPLENRQKAERIILLLVGSERGFCGNFNERVLTALDEFPDLDVTPELIPVGQRLGNRLAARHGIISAPIARLAGPTVTEDVPAVLAALMNTLHQLSLQASPAGVALYSLAHDADGNLQLKRLLPLPELPVSDFAQPPQIQLPLRQFRTELLDQYLLAVLHGLLYESLAAENRQRLAHMEHALDRLEETLAALVLKRNALRQEKIIEEIEVMLGGERT